MQGAGGPAHGAWPRGSLMPAGIPSSLLLPQNESHESAGKPLENPINLSEGHRVSARPCRREQEDGH